MQLTKQQSGKLGSVVRRFCSIDTKDKPENIERALESTHGALEKMADSILKGEATESHPFLSPRTMKQRRSSEIPFGADMQRVCAYTNPQTGIHALVGMSADGAHEDA